MNTELPINKSRFSIPNYNRGNAEDPNNIGNIQTSSESREIDYERLGFFQVVNNPDDPKLASEQLLDAHREECKEEKGRLTTVHENELDRFEQQIKSFEELIKEEKEKLSAYVEIQLDQEEKKEKLSQELQKLEEQLLTLEKALGKRKASQINDRILKVKEELHSLVDTLDEIATKKHKINKDTYERNKNVLKNEAILLGKLSKNYEDALNNLKMAISNLQKKGVSPPIAQFLIYCGSAATGAAGWLFSIFSVKREFDEEDWIFFTLESLYFFGEQLRVDMGLPSWLWVVVFLLSFMVLLTFIVGIAWCCKKLLEKWVLPTKDRQKIKIHGRSEHVEFDKEVTSSSFLGLWLNILPYVFIVGVIFIVVQVGTDIDKLRSLDISLSGQFIGSILALMFGGLGFTYVSKVIAPRYDDENKNGETPKQQKLFKNLVKSFEIVLLLLVFLVTFGLMYYYQEAGTGALIGFVGSSLVGGFLLGTGLQYKGLLGNKYYLEWKLEGLLYRMRYREGPEFSYLTSMENEHFRKKFLALENELMELLIAKTRELHPGYGRHVNNQTKKAKNTLAPLYRFLGIEKSKADVLEELPSPIDMALFPEETTEITHVKEQRTQVKQELQELTEQMESLKEENTEYQKKIKELITTVMEQLDDCRRKISEQIIWYGEKLRELQNRTKQNEISLNNGFDLGNWHLKYGTKK